MKYMKIELFEEYELTTEFLKKHTLDDVYLFSYAEPGANGKPGNIEAVIKTSDKEISVYSGSYLFENEKLDKESVISFFHIKDSEDVNWEEWDCLNMGLGNCLFVRKEFASAYKERYDKLIEKLPYILYANWRTFTAYYLNLYFNKIDDKKMLEEANDQLKELDEIYFN